MVVLPPECFLGRRHKALEDAEKLLAVDPTGYSHSAATWERERELPILGGNQARNVHTIVYGPAVACLGKKVN